MVLYRYATHPSHHVSCLINRYLSILFLQLLNSLRLDLSFSLRKIFKVIYLLTILFILLDRLSRLLNIIIKQLEFFLERLLWLTEEMIDTHFELSPCPVLIVSLVVILSHIEQDSRIAWRQLQSLNKITVSLLVSSHIQINTSSIVVRFVKLRINFNGLRIVLKSSS